MAPDSPRRPQVLVDVDVLFAGAASPSERRASLVVLRAAEITLSDAFASAQAIVEAEHNLTAKLPQALPTFRLLVSRCLQWVIDPTPDALAEHVGRASETDLPILVAALREDCRWLVTFNLRHCQPGHPDVAVVRPGEFVRRLRDPLALLGTGDGG